MNLTVVGLGQKCGDVTMNGQSAIISAELVLVRTNQSVASTILHKLKLKEDNIESFDEFYDLAENFDHLNELIVGRITQLAQDYKNIVYCVDGDGVSDSSVEMLSSHFSLTIIPGVAEASYRVPSPCAVSITATALLASKICIDTALPLVVTQIDNPLVAGNVKLCLLNFYSYDATCTLTVGQKKVQLVLEDIDRQKKYGYSTTLFIAAQGSSGKDKYCIGDLLRLLPHVPNRADMPSSSMSGGGTASYQNGEDSIENLENNLLAALEDIDSAERSGEVEFSDIVSGIGAKLYAANRQVLDKIAKEEKR